MKLSRKAKIIITVLIIAQIPFLIFHIPDLVMQRNHRKGVETAFQEVFVTERNELQLLQEAIGEVIRTPDEAHYLKAFQTAARTEELCREAYAKADYVTVTYNAICVYYSTFYRDIKKALTLRCSEDDLQYLYDLLDDIIALHDCRAESAQEVGKETAIRRFYESLTLIYEDMMLCNILESLEGSVPAP